MHCSDFYRNSNSKIYANRSGRILKHLAAMEVIREVDADSYVPTKFANALAVPKYRDGISFWYANDSHYFLPSLDTLLTETYINSFDCIGPSFMKLPEYLAKTGYKNPHSSVDGPFQYGHKSPLQLFEWLKAHPNVQNTFNNHMAGYRSGRQNWSDFYPVDERLGKGMNTDKDAVLLVDVGGGLGHDLEEFRSKHPSLSGRLILQDQAVVIPEITNIHQSIEPMIHDFWTAQPIKGKTHP